MRFPFALLALGLALPALPGCVVAIGNKADVEPGDWDSDGEVYFGFGASDQDAIRGSGTRATRALSVEPFHAVSAVGWVDTEVWVRPGAHEVEVVGDDNLVGHVVAEVRDGALHISWEKGVRARPSVATVVRVYTPELDRISLTGSCDVEVDGVQTERFVAQLSGSGDMEVDGDCVELEVHLSGSGDMSLGGLRSQRAVVSLSGSGDVAVYAAEGAEVELNGSGDVVVKGRPGNLSTRVSGSGEVRGG